MLLKDIPSWLDTASDYWYGQICNYTDLIEIRALLSSLAGEYIEGLITSYETYKINSDKDELISRLKAMVTYLMLTTGISTVPECPPVLSSIMSNNLDLRLLYEAWAVTDAPDDPSGLFIIEVSTSSEGGTPSTSLEGDTSSTSSEGTSSLPVPSISITSVYTDLRNILDMGNEVDSERVMYLVKHIPEAIFDRLNYLNTNKPNITTLIKPDLNMENQIKSETYFNEVNEYFEWGINNFI